MNRLWQQLAIATNWPILLAVVVLSLLGVLSVWADAPADGEKQLAFLALGVVCMFAVQAVSYQRIGRYAWVFYIISLLMLIYTIVPLTHAPRGDQRLLRVPETNGAFAWINFGPLRLQPAELTKIAFCMVLARYLRFRSNYRTFAGLLPPFLLAVVPLLLILRQPDMGTAMVFIPALFAMLFVAGARMRHLLAVMGMGAVLMVVAWLAGPAPDGPGLPLFRHLPVMVKTYQRNRIRVMFVSDPQRDADLRAVAFQQDRALIAMGSGGVTGKGPFSIDVGRQVPEAHNDMIMALIGEQFGFIGSAVLLGAYLVLFAAGVEVSAATREPFGRLMAVGIVSLLAGQAFLNLTVAMRLMPVTGVTLPFVSYGGSSMLASCIAAGFLLNIGQNRPLVMARESFDFD